MGNFSSLPSWIGMENNHDDDDDNVGQELSSSSTRKRDREESPPSPQQQVINGDNGILWSTPPTIIDMDGDAVEIVQVILDDNDKNEKHEAKEEEQSPIPKRKSYNMRPRPPPKRAEVATGRKSRYIPSPERQQLDGAVGKGRHGSKGTKRGKGKTSQRTIKQQGEEDTSPVLPSSSMHMSSPLQYIHPLLLADKIDPEDERDAAKNCNNIDDDKKGDELEDAAPPTTLSSMMELSNDADDKQQRNETGNGDGVMHDMDPTGGGGGHIICDDSESGRVVIVGPMAAALDAHMRQVYTTFAIASGQ